MTPSEALHSPIFLAYAAIVGGIIVLAGGVLTAITFGLRKDVRPIWITWRSWVVVAPLFLGSILLGSWTAVGFLALLMILGFKEFARATGLYRDWAMTGAAYVGILAAAAMSVVPDPNTGRPGWYGLFMALPVYVISLVLIIPICRDRTKGQIQAIFLAIGGFFFAGWSLGHLAMLTASNNPYGYILYLVFAVAINDVAAFAFGKLLGRHKLRPNISPNKTWEGSLGALAVSMALPWALGFSFPHFGPWQKILTGLIVGVGGQLGDLAMSVIKRDIGIKDMGAVIPGHGGIMDRIDSLIFTAPIFFHLVNYNQDIW